MKERQKQKKEILKRWDLMGKEDIQRVVGWYFKKWAKPKGQKKLFGD